MPVTFSTLGNILKSMSEIPIACKISIKTHFRIDRKTCLVTRYGYCELAEIYLPKIWPYKLAFHECSKIELIEDSRRKTRYKEHTLPLPIIKPISHCKLPAEKENVFNKSTSRSRRKEKNEKRKDENYGLLDSCS